jgi:hypothetical protein
MANVIVAAIRFEEQKVRVAWGTTRVVMKLQKIEMINEMPQKSTLLKDLPLLSYSKV